MDSDLLVPPRRNLFDHRLRSLRIGPHQDHHLHDQLVEIEASTSLLATECIHLLVSVPLRIHLCIQHPNHKGQRQHFAGVRGLFPMYHLHRRQGLYLGRFSIQLRLGHVERLCYFIVGYLVVLHLLLIMGDAPLLVSTI